MHELKGAYVGEIDLARAGSMQKFAFVDRTVSAYEEMAGSRTPRRTGLDAGAVFLRRIPRG